MEYSEEIKELEKLIDMQKKALIKEHFDCLFDCDRLFPDEKDICEKNKENRISCRSDCNDKYTRDSEKFVLPYRKQIERYKMIKKYYVHN